MNYYTYLLADDVRIEGLANEVGVDNDFCVAVFVYIGEGEPTDTHRFWTKPGWHTKWIQIGQGTSNGQDWYDAALTCVEFSRRCREEHAPFYMWDDADEEWTTYTLNSSLVVNDWQYTEEER